MRVMLAHENARVTGDQIEFIQHVMSATWKSWTGLWTGLD